MHCRIAVRIAKIKYIAINNDGPIFGQSGVSWYPPTSSAIQASSAIIGEEEAKISMIGLKAYMDESGHSHDPNCRFVGLGGLCASEESWNIFSEKWQSILDDQCGGAWFHMKDFAVRAGTYKGWNEAKRRKLLGSLAAAIVEARPRPFGAVVSLDAYNYLVECFPGVDEFFNEPYHLCFQDVTRAAALQAMEFSWPFVQEGVEQVGMTFAEQREYGAIWSVQGTPREQMGKAESLWYAVRDANPHFGQWMGSYSTGHPSESCFLQAADLFAYELTHEFENRSNPKRAGDDMRWALAQMLPKNSRNFLHRFYGLEQLVELLLDNKRLEVTHDQECAGSINSSLMKIALRDSLSQRMSERLRKDGAA